MVVVDAMNLAEKALTMARAAQFTTEVRVKVEAAMDASENERGPLLTDALAAAVEAMDALTELLIVARVEAGYEGAEDPGEDISEPSAPLDPETVEKLRDKHGIELSDWKPTIPPHSVGIDGLRSKLAGWHFSKESLTDGEREILAVAEAVLAELDRRDADGYAR